MTVTTKKMKNEHRSAQAIFDIAQLYDLSETKITQSPHYAPMYIRTYIRHTTRNRHEKQALTYMTVHRNQQTPASKRPKYVLVNYQVTSRTSCQTSTGRSNKLPAPNARWPKIRAHDIFQLICWHSHEKRLSNSIRV